MAEIFKGSKINGDFKDKHIVSIDQFRPEDLTILYAESAAAEIMRGEIGKTDILHGKLLANLFYQPSTRTSRSFSSAMHRLGGEVELIDNVEYSSVAKGESLTDTIRTMEQYTDVTVLRHPEVGAAALAASVAEHPIINAGDGIGEHPTQALLDLYTIKKSFKDIGGLAITMVGDLKNGRTVHSLAKLAAMYDVRINYVSPPELTMPDYIRKQLADLGIEQNEYPDIESSLADTDVLYMTRVQKEWFEDEVEYERLKHAFVLDGETMEHASDNMIVMHPLPRVGEIAKEVDADSRAKYFEQMANGMYVRMGLLALVLGKSLLPTTIAEHRVLTER